jgi:glycosyltransferase involved in cell wall biosynthesis
VRVLSILPFSPPSPELGGAELQMHSLHRGLRERGVDVQVLADAALVGEGRREHDGVSVWGVPLPALTASPLRPGNARLWLRRRALLRFVERNLGKVDLVQATPLRQPALWAADIARASEAPWVVRMACSGTHGDARFMRSHWQTRRRLPALLRSAAALVVLDAATAEEAAALGADRERIVRIPNGLDVAKLPDAERAAEPPANGSIAFVGRLAPQKRVATLVGAYAELVLSAEGEDALLPPLELAGGGDVDGVREMARARGVMGRVTLPGHVDPGPLLARARCFVNPSESEGLPNAVLEACAHGVPPVLSDIPVHREIATAAGTADLLFPVGDERALAASLGRFLALPPERERELRRRACAYGRGFTARARDDAYLALYERVLRERRRA